MQGALVDLLGKGILAGAGHVDRRELSNRYYYDPEAKRAVDQIVDPLLAKELEERVRRVQAGSAFVLLDWALLVERGALAIVDWNVLIVSCSPATQLERLAGGDLPMDQLMRRINLQWSNEEKRARAQEAQAAEGRGLLLEVSSEGEPDWSEVDEFLCKLRGAARGAVNG
jgi:dephospho-CoA kinase